MKQNKTTAGRPSLFYICVCANSTFVNGGNDLFVCYHSVIWEKIIEIPNLSFFCVLKSQKHISFAYSKLC